MTMNVPSCSDLVSVRELPDDGERPCPLIPADAGIQPLPQCKANRVSVGLERAEVVAGLLAAGQAEKSCIMQRDRIRACERVTKSPAGGDRPCPLVPAPAGMSDGFRTDSGAGMSGNFLTDAHAGTLIVAATP